MKIAIISDTHVNKRFEKFDEFLSTHLKDVDSIIHVGDYTNKEVIEKLKDKGDFIGVYGNVDRQDIKEELSEEELIEAEGFKIGVFHGHGTKKTTIERAYERFEDEEVDVIIFGHSHQPIIKPMNKVIMINPGSPTDKRREKWFSYGILELEENLINPQLCFFQYEK